MNVSQSEFISYDSYKQSFSQSHIGRAIYNNEIKIIKKH